MRALWLSLVAVAALGAWYFLSRPDEWAEVESEDVLVSRESAETSPQLTLMPVAAEAGRLNVDTQDVGEDLAIVDGLLSFCRRLYGANPVGLNHEVVRSLAGGNAKRAAFLAPDHPAINERGELVDRWGTPFFFHQLSGTEMEIISAGPDGELWTEDDVKSG